MREVNDRCHAGRRDSNTSSVGSYASSMRSSDSSFPHSFLSSRRCSQESQSSLLSMRSINESPYEYDINNEVSLGNQHLQPPGTRLVSRVTAGRYVQGHPVGYNARPAPPNRNRLQHHQQTFSEKLTPCPTPQPHDIPNNQLRRASDPVYLSTEVASRLPFCQQRRSAGGVFKRCQSVSAVRHIPPPTTTTRRDALAANRQHNHGLSCMSLMSSRSSIATDLDAINESCCVDEGEIDRQLQEDAANYGSVTADIVLPLDETVDIFGVGGALHYVQPNTCRSNMFVQPRRNGWAWNESDTTFNHPVNFDLLDSDDGCKFNIEGVVNYPGGRLVQHRYESTPTGRRNSQQFLHSVDPVRRNYARAYPQSNESLARQVYEISGRQWRQTENEIDVNNNFNNNNNNHMNRVTLSRKPQYTPNYPHTMTTDQLPLRQQNGYPMQTISVGYIRDKHPLPGINYAAQKQQLGHGHNRQYLEDQSHKLQPQHIEWLEQQHIQQLRQQQQQQQQQQLHYMNRQHQLQRQRQLLLDPLTSSLDNVQGELKMKIGHDVSSNVDIGNDSGYAVQPSLQSIQCHNLDLSNGQVGYQVFLFSRTVASSRLQALAVDLFSHKLRSFPGIVSESCLVQLRALS